MRWLDIITGTEPREGFGVRVLKDSAAALAAPVSSYKPHVNQSEMAITSVLTTQSCDRQGDIVDPTGGDFSEHRRNPAVMFHHGKEYKLPIGKAEDRNGNYTVRHVPAHDGDVLIGTTHFMQRDESAAHRKQAAAEFAYDVFSLCAQDILRGVSIGFDPADGDDAVEKLGDSPVLERPALHFKAWKLLEYSHTPFGVNPNALTLGGGARDAITAIVHKALDGSRKLHPQLLAMLQPLAAPRRTTVSASDAKTNPARPAGAAPALVEKAMPQDDDDDDTGGMGDMDADDTGGAAAATAAQPDFDPTQDAPGDDPNLPEGYGAPSDQEMPPTVQTLTDGAQGILDLCSAIEAGMKKGEHMGGRKFAAKLCATLRKAAGDTNAFADKIHGELNGGDAATDDTAAPDADGDGDTSDSSKEESGAEPPTDDEGAIVKKGYSPRRWTYADIAAQTPAPAAQVAPVASARELKALRSENAELKRAMENLLEDLEAGANRR